MGFSRQEDWSRVPLPSPRKTGSGPQSQVLRTVVSVKWEVGDLFLKQFMKQSRPLSSTSCLNRYDLKFQLLNGILHNQ